MKRREFGSLVVLIVGGLVASGASMATGNKSNASTGATGASGAVPSAAPQASSPENFYITITTFFPKVMEKSEYKEMVKVCRNVEESDKLLDDMRAEGKLLRIEGHFYSDRVTTCFEFINEKAFNEYEHRFNKISGNSSKMKKQLGFRSQREFKKTLLT